MLAEITLSTGYVKRNDDAVAFFDSGNVRSGIFDDSHRLMSNNIVVVHAGDFPVINVKVRTANGCRGDAHNDVVLLFQLGVGYFFNFDFLLPLIGYCLHVEKHSFGSRVKNLARLNLLATYYVITPKSRCLSVVPRSLSPKCLSIQKNRIFLAASASLQAQPLPIQQ